MGLKYSTEFCPQAQLVLKMDDDIAVDLFQLLNLVRNQSLSGMQIAGAVMTGDELNPTFRLRMGLRHHSPSRHSTSQTRGIVAFFLD